VRYKTLSPFQTTLKARADFGRNVFQANTACCAEHDLIPFFAIRCSSVSPIFEGLIIR
jgi:hypothetical protein